MVPTAHPHHHRPARSGSRRVLGWLLLVAVVLATLAPGIARAIGAARGDATAWGVVCGSGGLVRANADASGAGTDRPASGAPDQEAHLFSHCPYCAVHADQLGLPPAAGLALADAPALRFAEPALFLQAPRPLFAWASAQARAPPFFA